MKKTTSPIACHAGRADLLPRKETSAPDVADNPIYTFNIKIKNCEYENGKIANILPNLVILYYMMVSIFFWILLYLLRHEKASIITRRS